VRSLASWSCRQLCRKFCRLCVWTDIQMQMILFWILCLNHEIFIILKLSWNAKHWNRWFSFKLSFRILIKANWMYNLQKNRNNQITYLFFVKNISQIILKANYKVIIMNCIYKINRYKLSLLIISDQIALNMRFYVAFYSMTREKMKDYCWVIKQLKTLYLQLKLSNSIVFVIDMKRDE
jgi:hypothetical protein